MSSTIRFLCDTGEVVNARSIELAAAGVKNKNKKIGKKYKNNKDSLNKNNFLLITYHSDFTGATVNRQNINVVYKSIITNK